MLAPKNIRTITIKGIVYVNQDGKLVPLANDKPEVESRPKSEGKQHAEAQDH